MNDVIIVLKRLIEEAGLEMSVADTMRLDDLIGAIGGLGGLPELFEIIDILANSTTERVTESEDEKEQEIYYAIYGMKEAIDTLKDSIENLEQVVD